MANGQIIETVKARSPLVAYFSMEIGLNPGVPTYVGGWVCWREIPSVPQPTSTFRWSR